MREPSVSASGERVRVRPTIRIVESRPSDDSGLIVCTECGRAVNEADAEREGWRYFSDGLGELLPFCQAR